MRIAGIILAAGRSSRMGSPKALLELHRTTFLAGISDRFMAVGADRVVAVVGRHHGAEIRRRMVGISLHFAVNPNPESGLIDSLRIGLQDILPQHHYILVSPVDCPAFTEATLRAMLAAAGCTDCIACVPARNGRRGHPVLLTAEARRRILAAEPRFTLRDLLHQWGAQVRIVEVDDPGIHVNINLPEDFVRFESGSGRERQQEDLNE